MSPSCPNYSPLSQLSLDPLSPFIPIRPLSLMIPMIPHCDPSYPLIIPPFIVLETAAISLATGPQLIC